jgi:hypothetical protein
MTGELQAGWLPRVGEGTNQVKLSVKNPASWSAAIFWGSITFLMCWIPVPVGSRPGNLGKTRAVMSRFWAGMLGSSGILAKNL